MSKYRILFVFLIGMLFLTACNPGIKSQTMAYVDEGGYTHLRLPIAITWDDVKEEVAEQPAAETEVVETPVVETEKVTVEDEVVLVTNASAPKDCSFAAPSGDPNNWPKTKIELAQLDTWFHRVFNERLFHAPDWGGADSWFVSLALGDNAGGNWTSMSNPGQITYRATSTQIQWCLGVVTDAQWKDQFMAGSTAENAAINVRIAPNSVVKVVTAGGKTIEQSTSDMGDITIILPDTGVVTISVSYTTAAPTHESLVWWGPYDRSENINTVDGRK